jgi:hypothetical protein
MSDKTFLNGILNRLKQKLPLFVVLLTFLVVYYLVYVFTASDKSPIAAAASRIAQAASPGISTSQATNVSYTKPAATRAVTPSAGLSSINLTQTASTQGNDDVLSPGDNTTDQNSTDQNNNPATPTFPVSNVTVHPTYTPMDLSPAATPGPGLPGLSMSNVIARLENEKGFDCEQVEFAPDPIVWMCDIDGGEDLWYHVDLYGSATVEVTSLMLNIVQTYPDEAKSLDMISFVASLPYNGSKPAEASRWVAQTLPGLQSYDDVVEKFFGTVRFRLYGDAQDRYLEIGELFEEE